MSTTGSSTGGWNGLSSTIGAKLTSGSVLTDTPGMKGVLALVGPIELAWSIVMLWTPSVRLPREDAPTLTLEKASTSEFKPAERAPRLLEFVSNGSLVGA